MKSFEKIEEMAAESANQYHLTLAMSKRVRAIREGAPCLVPDIKDPQQNAVKAAMAEFAQGLLTFTVEST